jgi:transposase
MAQPVKVHRLTEQERQKLQRIVRRSSMNTVRYRRAMIVLASAGGNTVPVIARLVQADEDTVRDVIHALNDKGLACLDPRWAGGRPHLLNHDDEDFVIETATTRPAALGLPFTHWSIRKLAAYLRRTPGRCVRIGREALRTLLIRRQVTFQRTKTWKESTDPDKETKLDRIDYAIHERPDRTFAFDEFGPLGIRPTAGACWAKTGSAGADKSSVLVRQHVGTRAEHRRAGHLGECRGGRSRPPPGRMIYRHPHSRRMSSRTVSASHRAVRSSRCIASGRSCPARSANDQQILRSRPDSNPVTNARAVARGSTRENRPAIQAVTSSMSTRQRSGLRYDLQPPHDLEESTHLTKITRWPY